ncbi:MAG: flagellar assembly protein FliW [Thermoanaerobacteraceae bacterium]|nr:flagellar assembly protein FliW [Thermoanaerobacteraceae bacterium]
MELETKRFGKIQVAEEKILHFQNGLLGFEGLSKFVLLDIDENPAFKWLQSAEDMGLSFLLVDPFLVAKDYSVELDDDLLAELEIERQEDVLVYTIVTVPPSGFKDATTNLVGPLVINWRKNRAKQVVLEDESLAIKYPLFPEQDNKKVASSGR